jgi:Coenzyme PQQ synthesis protein D (PqqD)
MSTESPTMSTSAILELRARVPDHVVHRQFAEETVVLNLKTGLYHGLNVSGGRMMELLERAPTVGSAAIDLAKEFGQPLETIQTDLAGFCAAMAQRELLVLQPAG